MSKQVMVEIPENIYQQVEEAARATNRRVSEVITETLTESFLYRQTSSDGEIESDEKQSLPREQIDAMDKETLAYEKIHPQLWKEYPQQFVAIYHGSVIDFDPDEQTLINRLDANYPYPDYVVLVRQVMPELPKPLYIRSPRFVRG